MKSGSDKLISGGLIEYVTTCETSSSGRCPGTENPNLISLQDHNIGCTLPNKHNPFMNTPFFDEPKEDKLQPADIAKSVLFALSAEESACVREVYVMPAK